MNKDLKHMSRSQLLEMLITQIEDNEKLSSELALCKEQLKKKKIAIKNSGSIAEAALKLNGIFEAADAAVKEYVLSVTGGEVFNLKTVELQSAETQTDVFDESLNSDELLFDAEENDELKEQANDIISAAKEEARKIIIIANAEADKIKRDAEKCYENALKKVKALGIN